MTQRWSSSNRTAVVVTDGAASRTVLAEDWTGGPVEAHAPTADDVRREASRRMQALLDARDAAHLAVLIANGSREAIRLLRKGAAAWTAEEAARAAQLEALDAEIERLRAVSNALEPNPPADFAADSRWSAP